jgi:hypothetical protein
MASKFLFQPNQRGWHISYKGDGQDCPGCGRSHWHVGRMLAECAFCGTAIPIKDATSTSSTIIVHKNMTYNAQQRSEFFSKAA